jgi:hypothetical protein
VEDQPLFVFALQRAAPPLRLLRDALTGAGYPAGIGTGIAGEASDEELDRTDWEAAFVRWKEPELHEVWLIERDLMGEDPQAENAVANALRHTANVADSAGRLIATDHLRRTQAVYMCQILPALLADDDHPAWAALDIALRCLAENAEGLIYADDEGFYDADGEILLDETGEDDL